MPGSMTSQRTSGILLHPTSLPGRFGIGDLGPAAARWLDFLAAAGQGIWQVLPLGPTGYGDSPYQSFSSFAGNPYLVSPEALVEDGLLERADLGAAPAFPAERVDFGPVIAWKLTLLARAHARFATGATPALGEPYEAFRRAHAGWLEDFALFMALKHDHGGAPWTSWERGLVTREPGALAAARERLATAVDAQRFAQFLFFRQWSAVRERARAAKVRVVGDVPIVVAHDSADVWAHPGLFQLDGAGMPTVVAGVPPDYFAKTGQLWGNPLYDWQALERDGFRWWLDRLRAALEMVDVVRLDHFRGFEAYWQVPAGEPTAEHGEWVPGPGARFLEAVRSELGALPIIAEDLGLITPGVIALRDGFELPGMKVMQFAFDDGARNPFLPHHHVRNCVVYTGTHDNDTTRGWYATAPEAQRRLAHAYLGSDGGDFTWDLIRAGMASVADTFIVPLQDVLDLGTEARMNLPGREWGNWSWRCDEGALNAALAGRLAAMARIFGRSPAK
jgi:4-alpha-glucanotransferase